MSLMRVMEKGLRGRLSGNRRSRWVGTKDAKGVQQGVNRGCDLGSLWIGRLGIGIATAGTSGEMGTGSWRV